MNMKKQKNLPKSLAFLTATWFGFGKSPFMPGTIGSLAALPFIWGAIYWGGLAGLVYFILGVYLIGTIATKKVLTYTAHDPGFVVVDEVVGQSLAFVFVAHTMPVGWMWIAGFVLFRFFDIAKIWPACFFDKKVRTATGVMMDDVIAGLYAALVLYGMNCLI